MIKRQITITVNNRPWHITIFLPISCYDVKEILSTLKSIDCSTENINTAFTNLTSGQMNNGLTFTNPQLRKTISVWAIATSPDQYLNLITHELHHLAVQIASANKLDLEEEDVCYINGDIAQHLYDIIIPLVMPYNHIPLPSIPTQCLN